MTFARLFFLTMFRRSVAERRRQENNLWLLPVVILAGILSGCASIAPGHDPILVRQEQATQLLFITADKLLRWEYQNRERFPQFKAVSDKLRQNVPWALERARMAAKDYKKQRTEASKGVLVMSLATVENLLAEAQSVSSVVPSFNPPAPPALP